MILNSFINLNDLKYTRNLRARKKFKNYNFFTPHPFTSFKKNNVILQNFINIY